MQVDTIQQRFHIITPLLKFCSEARQFDICTQMSHFSYDVSTQSNFSDAFQMTVLYLQYSQKCKKYQIIPYGTYSILIAVTYLIPVA